MTAKTRAPLPDPPDVRQLARRSLADATAWLEAPRLPDRAVHAVRKELKRTRAMLRLMRAGLGERAYRRDNAELRDVARSLSGVRDSRVLLDTLQGLSRHRDGGASGGGQTDLRKQLRREHACARRLLQEEAAAVLRARPVLRAVRDRLGSGDSGIYRWSVLEAGLRRVYARARHALRRVRARSSAENLHELRKQTKYLWHQLQALAAPRDRRDGARVAATHRLSDLLGDDHNLAVLRHKALEAPLKPGARQRLVARIDAERARRIRQALALASRIYRDTPAVFAARVMRRTARE
ncbi:MAG: CHAD domain-containing protein [Steroidobacteraceae bacterium]